MREVSETPLGSIAYSFCTLVTDLAEYKAMVARFRSKGFAENDCEYLYIDNSKYNKFDAFAALNRFLQFASGKYVVLCHQDIVPIADDRNKLDELLDQLTRSHPHWGICGNAGADARGDLKVRISDPWHEDRNEGPFPAEVMSLDENFIIVRKDANLALSRDLSGFHWYGTDICVIADVLGWSSHVIDFHLRHNSKGNLNAEYYAIRNEFMRKIRRAFRPRWYFQMTWKPFYVSPSRLQTGFAFAKFKIHNLLLHLRKLAR